MKKIIGLLLIFLIMPIFVSAEIDVITNAKLHKAIINSVNVNIDENDDGILSQSEVSNFKDTLYLGNRNLNDSDIGELSKFTNITGLSLEKNNITSLEPFMGLNKLTYLSLAGNPYRCSFINGQEKCEDYYTLKSSIESRGGNLSIGGLIIDYDKSKITSSTPKYNILATIITETDADITMLSGQTGHTKYKMNEMDITLIKEYLRLYEMYVEKLTDYKIDINIDLYIDNKKLTTLVPDGSTEQGQETDVFASKLPELSSILPDYDSSIVVAYSHYNTHSFAGLAGWSNHRGEIYIPYDKMMYNFFTSAINNIGIRSEDEKNAIFSEAGINEDEFYNNLNNYQINSGNKLNTLIGLLRDNEIKKVMEQEITDLRNNIVTNAEVDTFIHEFCHNLESFSQFKGINTWEFHKALRMGEEYPGLKINTSDQTDYEGLYLRGYHNPDEDTEVGIQNSIYETPPTKFFVKNLTNIDAPVSNVTNNNGQINITWNSVSGATIYRVLRRNKNSSFDELLAYNTELEYTDNNPIKGVDYEYFVEAVEVAEFSYSDANHPNPDNTYESVHSTSNKTNVKIAESSLSTSPVLTLALTNNDVSLSWTSVEGATSYEVKRSESENGTYTVLVTLGSYANSYEDLDLDEGRTYYYKVTAKNGENSKDSSTKSVKLKGGVITENVTLNATLSNKNVNLSWNLVSAADKYEVRRSTSKSGSYSKIAEVTTNTYKDSNVNYNVTYYYKIIAKNDENSVSSNIVSKKIVPDKVTNLTLKANNKAITVSFKKVSGNGYELYYSLNGKKWTKLKTITSASTISFKHTKLSINKLYYYKVRAYKTVSGKKVFGAYSGIIKAKTAPAKPSVKIYSKGYNKILLNINKVSGANKYEIYRSTSKTKGFKKIATSTTTAYNDTTVLPTVTYYYKVRACNSYNACGDYSSVVNKKTSLKTISDLKKTLGNKEVNLTFSATSGASGYQVYRSTSKTTGFKKIGNTTETNYKDTTGEVNKTYYYKVRSYLSKDGKNYYSAYSNIVSAKVKEIE